MINKCLMCNNCEEIYKNSLKLYNLKNFLFETKNFIINVDSYPVAKNHIIIIPKYHYKSFSSIEIEKTDEIQYILNRISVIFNMTTYSIFEHGTNIVDEDKKICGNSIFHAHLHIIPNVNINPNDITENLKLKKNKDISDYTVKNSIKNFLNILKYDLPTENNYLLYINNDNYYCIPEEDIEGEIESQFFRKLVANKYNKGVYNWKDNDDFEKNKDTYKDNIESTLYNFKQNDTHVTFMKKIKLIRDNIVDLIQKEDRKITYYTAEKDEEYMYFLQKKLFEECNEFIESLSIDNKHIIEECADILEVIENILSLKNLSFNNIKDIKNQKNIKNGSFKKRHIGIFSQRNLGFSFSDAEPAIT